MILRTQDRTVSATRGYVVRAQIFFSVLWGETSFGSDCRGYYIHNHLLADLVISPLFGCVCFPLELESARARNGFDKLVMPGFHEARVHWDYRHGHEGGIREWMPASPGPP